MDAAEIGVLIGGVSLIGFTLWFFFGAQRRQSTPTTNGAVIYACPMHPWIMNTEPTANCSICGMKIVKRD